MLRQSVLVASPRCMISDTSGSTSLMKLSYLLILLLCLDCCNSLFRNCPNQMSKTQNVQIRNNSKVSRVTPMYTGFLLNNAPFFKSDCDKHLHTVFKPLQPLSWGAAKMANERLQWISLCLALCSTRQ